MKYLIITITIIITGCTTNPERKNLHFHDPYNQDKPTEVALMDIEQLNHNKEQDHENHLNHTNKHHPYRLLL